MAPIIRLCLKQQQYRMLLILTGQHREMVNQVLAWFAIEPQHNLDIMAVGQTLGEITARSLLGLEALFEQEKPALVVVQGDTTTAFAACLAAFYQRIPVAHVEAGLRTDDLYSPFPEEVNRRLISQMATLHFAPTEQAAVNLRASGVTSQVFITGNTGIDSLLLVAEHNHPLQVDGLDWRRQRVLLATVHRRENWGDGLGSIAEGFLRIVQTFPDTALLLPMHRNPLVRSVLQQALASHPRVFLCEPLSYPELVAAMRQCYMILTDSGGIQEEAPALGKPVLVLRDTTERPEAVAAGVARLVGADAQMIFHTAGELLTDPIQYQAMARALQLFGDGKAANRIIARMAEYLN